MANVTQKLKINYGHKTATFTRGRKRRVAIDDDFADITGVVKFADGSIRSAILTIDESSSGEFYGALIWLDDGQVTHQSDADFLQRLGKTKDEVFPYRYRYDIAPNCYDHHVGDDGWSR